LKALYGFIFVPWTSRILASYIPMKVFRHSKVTVIYIGLVCPGRLEQSRDNAWKRKLPKIRLPLLFTDFHSVKWVGNNIGRPDIASPQAGWSNPPGQSLHYRRLHGWSRIGNTLTAIVYPTQCTKLNRTQSTPQNGSLNWFQQICALYAFMQDNIVLLSQSCEIGI
jgi:hypothetical protein